jgi:N-acetylglucosamine kinase-like BadF-type ATPase
MSAERLLLGVDGGNTKAVAAVARPDGTIVGTARVLRGSDIYAVPEDEAIAVHHQVADRALAAAGTAGGSGSDAPRTPSLTAAFSLAGADWPEDIALLERRLRERWPTAVVVNDAIGALRAAIPSGPGVVVVCGTGAATGARGPDGRTWHSSFWQEPQGAHELGVQTLKAVFRADLRIDPPTALVPRVLTATGEPNVEALLHHATARAVTRRRDPALLTWVLLDAAEAGDATACAIVERQGRELGRTALAAAARVGIDPDAAFSLALAGGVLRHPGPGLREAIVSTVLAAAPRAHVLGPGLEPVAGALLLAFDAAGIKADDAVLERIAAGLAVADLYETHPERAVRD